MLQNFPKKTIETSIDGNIQRYVGYGLGLSTAEDELNESLRIAGSCVGLDLIIFSYAAGKYQTHTQIMDTREPTISGTYLARCVD